MKQLYDWQLEDCLKLAPYAGALVGSEMGSGKSLVALALAYTYRLAGGEGPCLILAPLNTFAGWEGQIYDQDPGATVWIVGRTKKARNEWLNRIAATVAAGAPGDYFLCHYEGARMLPGLSAVQWGVIIADEVHRIGNRKAAQTKALKNLRAHKRIGLSGTPSGDNPENLFSVLQWLWPNDWKSAWEYRRRFCKIEKTTYGDQVYERVVGSRNEQELQRLIEPYFVRHLKREQCCPAHPRGVMSYLPPVVHDVIEVELSPKQRKAYESMKRDLIAWVGANENVPLIAEVAIAQLTRLSQIALATPTVSAYVDANGEQVIDVELELPSSKIEAVAERIADLGGRKVVVFTSSRKAALLAWTHFNNKGIDSVVLSGQTSDRQGALDSFVTGPKQVLIGVIAAISEGIDGLQNVCDTAIFLDRSWSNYLNEQAIARLDRGGQANSVTVIDVVARDTIDEARAERLETKWDWMRKVLGDAK